MTTTQATGREQQAKRLCWVLKTMIEQLEGSTPENALGCIEEHEDEAAKLIESTGLADEAEIRAEFRPVLKRTMLGWEEFGIGDAPHEKHPTYVSYQFTESSGMFHSRKFDALTAMGLAMPKLDPPPKGWQKSKPPPGSWAEKLQQQLGSMSRGPRFREPDASFVQTLVMCLKGWLSRAQWKASGEVPGERDVIAYPMPARWFHKRTNGVLTADQLSKAYRAKRIVGEKRAGRNYYSVDSVIAVYPEHAPSLKPEKH